LVFIAILDRLKWIGMEEVGFGLPAMDWYGRSWF
jgi:hypothetical protein